MQTIQFFFDTLSRRLNAGVEYLLFGLGISMSLIVAVQVFFRYALNSSLFWSEELARFMLVWLTFLGASAAYRRGVHPGVDVLYRRMPPWLKRTSAVLIHLVSIGLFCVMIVYGYQFAHFVRFQISPALYLPKWIVFSIIPVSGGILTLHGLAFLLAELTEEHHDR
jgi:TRAP-type C4-dicarboxylate transport system permease small subunit